MQDVMKLKDNEHFRKISFYLLWKPDSSKWLFQTNPEAASKSIGLRKRPHVAGKRQMKFSLSMLLLT